MIRAYVSVVTGTFLPRLLAVAFSASVNPILVTRHDHHKHTSRRLPAAYIDMSKKSHETSPATFVVEVKRGTSRQSFQTHSLESDKFGAAEKLYSVTRE